VGLALFIQNIIGSSPADTHSTSRYKSILGFTGGDCCHPTDVALLLFCGTQQQKETFCQIGYAVTKESFARNASVPCSTRPAMAEDKDSEEDFAFSL